MITKNDIIQKIESTNPRSAWDKGVKNYAIDLVDGMEEGQEFSCQSLLNGAQDWSQYSYGGCALIYDADIAKALCSPSELKSRKGGEWQPSKSKTWLDVQADALKQACNLILRTYKRETRQAYAL